MILFFGFLYFRIVREIARSVDLTTLDALSRTCRQFHLNLIPYRQQLVKRTLRCENEYVETVADMLQNGTAIPDSVKSVLQILNQGSVESGRLTRGKVAKCARDMVAECRKCSKVVCRVYQHQPGRVSILHANLQSMIELHDQVSDEHDAQKPNTSIMHNMSHCSDLLPFCTCFSPAYSLLPQPLTSTVTRTNTPSYRPFQLHCAGLSAHPMHLRRSRMALPSMWAHRSRERHDLPPGMGLAHAIQHIPRRPGHGNRRRLPGGEMWARRGLPRKPRDGVGGSQRGRRGNISIVRSTQPSWSSLSTFQQ